MSITQERNTSHVGIIDAVRGLAALSVAYMHCREVIWIGMRDYWETHAFDLSPSSIVAFATFPVIWGSVGVPVLFVVSGYVIHRRAAKMLARGNLLSFSTSEFLLRRFIRIYPTFVAAIALTYICDTISRTYVDHHKLGDLDSRTFVWNLLAMQGVFAKSYGSNGPLWSLGIEIQFYLVYPLILMLREKIGMTRMLFVSIAISIVGYFFLERHGIVAFPQYYFSWWLGAYLADYEIHGKKLPYCWPFFSGLFVLAGCLIYLLNQHFFAFMAWAIGFTPILSYLISKHRSKPPARIALLNRFGGFSYSIYSVHLPLAILISAVWFSGVHQVNIYWSILVAAIIIVLSYGFYIIAERPFVKLLQSLSRKFR